MKIQKILPFVAIGILASLPWTLPLFESSEPEEEQASQEASGSSLLIQLSPEKLAKARIQTQPVSPTRITITKVLPARFTYDDRKHVMVRSATEGILETVNVKPGDSVEKGQILASMHCPSIAEARGMVLRRRAELEIAEQESQWNSDICAGVENVVEQIEANTDIETIRKQASESTLGKYRDQLLANYSKSLLSEQLLESAMQSADGISGSVRRQRKSEQEQAKAALAASIEQSLFETGQECKIAQAQLSDAQRQLELAIQNLATLLGVPHEVAEAWSESGDKSDLSLLQIASPIAGTVEKRNFSATERVQQNAELFVIADTSTLWVEADIRDRDWDALQVKEGDQVQISTPAKPQSPLTGTVYFVGREVDQSGAIPLVVEATNANNAFRPGQFARVRVPTGVVDQALAVPVSSVVDVNGNPTVFVAEGQHFRPVTVVTGAANESQIEIQSGLEVGQSVVVEGAFQLKSELLLESEE